MDIYFMDVEHGSCAAVRTPSQHWFLIDCGHNGTSGWRPSDWLAHNRLKLHLLVVSNLDEDHVTDLPSLHRTNKPERFRTNWRLQPDWVLRQKQAIGGPRPGVAHAISYMRSYTAPGTPVDYGVRMNFFCNGPANFTDFNNLSVVTFLSLNSFCICFPGDLETEGWRTLLQDPDFVAHLRSVKVFIASHHGRESGYCEEVFRHCSPDVVLVSDRSIAYGTQEGMVQRYRASTRGVPFNGGNRHVLTTRRDGAIHVGVQANGAFGIEPY